MYDAVVLETPVEKDINLKVTQKVSLSYRNWNLVLYWDKKN